MTYSSLHSKNDPEWVKTRATWVRLNPPNHQGQYVCGICGQSVHKDDMEVDHIIPRSGDPASKYDLQNLQPTHGFCNQQKGSQRFQPVISAAEYELRRKLDL